MFELTLSKQMGSIHSVLCLGSHCDDIEIGCGGTILTLIKNNRDIVFHWVIFSSDQQRKQEANESAKVFLKDAKKRKIVFKNFRNSFFPYVGVEIKEYFERLKRQCCPDLIFTHYRNDLHQDHRLISELTWNTFRNHLILEYEIPKYDGDLGSPNCFVLLEDSICRKKIQSILNSYKSQEKKRWFDQDTFLAILRLRGMESNAGDRYAEAFYCRKIVLG